MASRRDPEPLHLAEIIERRQNHGIIRRRSTVTQTSEKRAPQIEPHAGCCQAS